MAPTKKSAGHYGSKGDPIGKKSEEHSEICGPPEKGQERQTEDQLGDLVTIEAANIYERRTGKSAVRHIDRVSGKPFGDFHSFLVRVFEVLEIKSSPDARNMQLQATLRGMKKK